MKKTYTRPMASIERFALTQSIAACVRIANYTDANCIKGNTSIPFQWWDLADGGMFMDTSCIDKPNIGQDYSGICFHTNASPTFTS